MIGLGSVAANLPGTVHAISEVTGLKAYQVRRALKRLKETNDCYIGDWERSSRGICPVWYEGSGTDAPCTLQPLTKAFHNSRYYARRKAEREGAKHEQDAVTEVKQVTRPATNGAKLPVDPLINALFGR